MRSRFFILSFPIDLIRWAHALVPSRLQIVIIDSGVNYLSDHIHAWTKYKYKTRACRARDQVHPYQEIR
jgi:hypothetical protein